MFKSMEGSAGERKNQKNQSQQQTKKKKKAAAAQASSRKGCMRGKGGPDNAFCTYKGVRQRTWGKWVAEIREPNRGARVWLGTFDSSHEAAIAYDAAALRLYGPQAKLNLPEQAIHYPQYPQHTITHNNIPINIGTQLDYSQNCGVKMKIDPHMQLQLHHQNQPSVHSANSPESAISALTDDDQSMVLDIQDILGTIDFFQLETTDQNQTHSNCQENHFRQMQAHNYNNHQERVGENEFDHQGFWGNLNANLPEFDNSSIWAEAVATMDFQTVSSDPGIFSNRYDDGIGIGMNDRPFL